MAHEEELAKVWIFSKLDRSDLQRIGKVVVAQMMKAALSADHRVTDGAQGAQFLHEIRRLLENPAALLI